jgi:hypothetical protein
LPIDRRIGLDENIHDEREDHMKTSRLNCGMRWLAASVAAAGLMTFASVALADEPRPEQMREQMRNLEQKAKELQAAGQEDQANAVRHEMQELREKFARIAKERHGDQAVGDDRHADLAKKLEHARAELKEAREGGNKERAEELQRGIHKLETELAPRQQRSVHERGAVPPEQLREQMRKLEQKAKELKEAGKEDQAQAVVREMQELREKAAHMTRQRDGDERRAQLQHREREPQPHPEQASMEQRLQHLREAVGHLHAAGLHEPAERLAQEAEHMQQQMRMQAQGGGTEVARLQAEIQDLRQAVRRLNERLEQKHEQR